MTDLRAEAGRLPSDRPAALSGAELDAQIRAAELAVIQRDERVRRRIDVVQERIQRKGSVGLALGGLAGGAAWLLARLWRARHKPHPPVPVADPPQSTGSPLLKALALLLPLLTGAARRGLPGGTPAGLMAMALPMVGQFVTARRAQGARRASLAGPPVRSAAQFDLQRYLGRWYEVARLPTPYEKHCAADTMASYANAGRGRLSVVNSCRRSNGRRSSAHGVARVVEGSGNARLKVSFAPPLLRALPLAWRDYWVLLVDDDYRYALAGTPDRRGLWLLSRTPSLTRADQQRLLDHARAQGYDTGALVSTPRLGADDVR